MQSSTPPGVRPAARWVLPSAVNQDRVKALRAALSLPEPLCALLAARGIDDPDTARRYLYPGLGHLHSPALMLDMDRAVARIVDAIGKQETILVHGDYDVDGIASTALLTRVLRALGATVVPFIPHRVADGYDLTDAGVREAIDKGASLVVTCDCGSSAREPVAALNAAGIDVIITDHHPPGLPLPAALAVLNPRRPGCEYPDKDLVAAGVVFKLALALTRAMGGDESDVFGMLDLVAFATVADVAPLKGENRVLVRHGLGQLSESRLPGIRALMRSSGLERKELTAGRVSFILAPRLNATGRVGTAMRGLELLLTEIEDTAFGIARELEELNIKRQEIGRTTLDEARRLLDTIDLEKTFGIVLARAGWHAGVIGIVATRIVEQTGRPTMLVAVENGVGKGSGRSIPRFDLGEALTECREHLVRYGGHHAAAGLTIEPAMIPAFAARFNEVATARLTTDDLRPDLRIDLELPLVNATLELVNVLADCEPHGLGNPGPMFIARGVRSDVRPRRVGETGVRLRLSQDGAAIDAIAWDFAPRIDSIDWSAPMDVAYRLERDEWQGRVRLQARVVDVRQ